MAKLKEEQKLVVITSNGSLTELGGITGPIINPCYLPISTIVRLLNGHKKVFEVNPANKEEKIALTLKNVKTTNFTAPVVNTKANVAPVVKTEKVVVEETKEATTTKENKKETKGDFTKK